MESTATKLQDTETHEMDSSKSYAVSVCLVGVFGTVGVHHFYLGRWLHGAFDLSLVIMTVGFLFIFWPLSVVTLDILIGSWVATFMTR